MNRTEGRSGGLARAPNNVDDHLPIQPDAGAIEMGTVGWDGEDAHFDQEEGDAPGVTLVRVTLYRGRDPNSVHTPDRAQGLQVLARISAPLWFIPPKGAQVLVARPAGFDGPGLWHIFCAPGANPPIQFDGKRALQDFGPDMDLVIKARSVTLSDYEDRFLTLGPKFGFKLGDAGANGMQLKSGKWMMWTAAGGDAKAVFKLSNDDITLVQKGTVTVSMKLADGGWACSGTSFKALTGNVLLGANASPVSSAQYGPGFGLPSTTVFIQP